MMHKQYIVTVSDSVVITFLQFYLQEHEMFLL